MPVEPEALGLRPKPPQCSQCTRCLPYALMHVWVLNCFSHVWICVTLWTAACQAPLSMGFSRQEYQSGLPFPPPGDLPDPGIQQESPASPALQADSLPLSLQGSLCLLHIHTLKPCGSLRREVRTLFPFHGWEEASTAESRALCKITRVVIRRMWIWTQAIWLQSPRS